YNDADQRYLEDFAVIPLYQQPVLLAWTANLEGPIHNPWSTDLWNVGAWTGQSEIVVATDGDPASLTAPLPTDDAAAMIMGAIYRGAYRVDLSGEYEADLVTGVEVLLWGG